MGQPAAYRVGHIRGQGHLLDTVGRISDSRNFAATVDGIGLGNWPYRLNPVRDVPLPGCRLMRIFGF